MAIKKTETVLKGLDSKLTKYLNDSNLPGLAVGVIKEGELVYFGGFGYANLEQKTPVTKETVFRIGSISKTFTVAGLMQLHEQGKFNLDDPVNDYLKDYKVLHNDPGAPPVTFRHMITHTAGIGEIRNLGDFLKPVMGLGAKPEDPEITLAEYYSGRLTPEIYPGEKVAYANHAYATLGQLVEDISGMPFAEYMKKNVFEPLGMAHSDFLFSETVKDQFSNAYEFKKGKFEPVEFLRIEVPAAGSIFSTVSDMTQYVAALMNEGKNENGQLVSPETYQLMRTPQLEFPEEVNVNFGLYFVLTNYGNHKIIWHNGGWPGYSSAMYIAPDDKLGVVVFTNTSNPAPDMIASEILRDLLGEPDPVKEVPVPGLLETPHKWEALSGFYGPKPGFLTNIRLWGGFGAELEVFTKDNHLAIRSLVGGLSKGLVLHRASKENPYVYQGVTGKSVTRVVFETDASGEPVKMRMGMNEFYKRPWFQSNKFKFSTVLGALAGGIIFSILKKVFTKKSKR